MDEGGGSSTSPSSATPLPSVSGTLVNRSLAITIDAASPLAAVGGAATVTASTGTYLVSRTAQNAFTAVTAVCTHEGCAVTGFANSRLRVSLPRLGVQHQRRGGDGAGLVGAAGVPGDIREQTW